MGGEKRPREEMGGEKRPEMSNLVQHFTVCTPVYVKAVGLNGVSVQQV